jgi:hypothetical protein
LETITTCWRAAKSGRGRRQASGYPITIEVLRISDDGTEAIGACA